MSDFLVSEILVLILLLPSSLRPFSKSLKKACAVPLLPLFAASILVFIIFGQGITVSLLPVIVIVAVCIITEFPRFVLFLSKLPNNFYSIYSVLIRIFTLALLGGAFFSAVYFSPEREYGAEVFEILKEKMELNLNGRKFCAGVSYTPQNTKDEHITVLVLNAYPDRIYGENTLSRFSAAARYKTVELTNAENSNLTYRPPHYEQFRAALYAILKKYFQDDRSIQNEPFNSVISEVLNHKKNTAVYAIAEGKYIQALYDYYTKKPDAFAGIFFILSEEDEIKGLNKTASYILDEREPLRFSPELANFPVCLFIRQKEKCAGSGELRCTDILAAQLLGSSRDLGRKDRLATAAVFEKWLGIRSGIKIFK